MPQRVVINCCFGGFRLSEEATAMYKQATQKEADAPDDAQDGWMDRDILRADPVLLRIIDEIGLQRAGGPFSKLGIAEIPDDVPPGGWIIQEYDGQEWVAEVHRTWRAN